MIKIDLDEIASHKTPIFAENTRKNGSDTPFFPRIMAHPAGARPAPSLKPVFDGRS
jgi:hypothetical protein